MTTQALDLDTERWVEVRILFALGCAYIALTATAEWLSRGRPWSVGDAIWYWALVVALVARYGLWIRLPITRPLSTDLPFLFTGVAIVLLIAHLVESYLSLYFLLLATEGGFVFLDRRWRWVWMSAMAGLCTWTGAHFIGWKDAGIALLHDLPVYAVIAVASELLFRQESMRTEVEELVQELAEVNRQMELYLEKAEALAVAEERARLAREIHDTLGHDLTALQVQIELAVRLPEKQESKRRTAIREAQQLVKNALRDLRRAVQALRPSALETFSLREAIEALVEDFRRQHPIDVAWSMTGDGERLAAPVAIALFRAAQEGLTNVVKHAGASRAEVTLEITDESAVLTVSDNGKGGTAPFGFGLTGLTERAENLGGEVRIRSPESGGFRLIVRLPR